MRTARLMGRLDGKLERLETILKNCKNDLNTSDNRMELLNIVKETKEVSSLLFKDHLLLRVH